jgi:hypothetical protein
MKKLFLSLFVIAIVCSCTASKDTTSDEKPEAPVQKNSIERDANGNYLR